MSKEVVITGLGPVTSIGVGCDPLWSSLSAGRSNVTTRKLPVDVGRMAYLPVASMPPAADVPGLGPHLAFLAEQDCPGYRDLAYALLAVELALADAGLSEDREWRRIGAIQAFEAPGVEATVSQLFGMLSSPLPPNAPPPVYDVLAPRFYHMQAFSYVHLVGKAFGLHGYSTSVHNACSSGAFAIEAAAQRIRAGDADAMIVVGGEAFETGVRLEWFRRLELYAPDERMRPFDTDPSGFFVGEGAAAIVLESAEHAAARGAECYATYAGGGFAQQGWKQTIPDIRSARLADVIRCALDTAGLGASGIDLIVPHGAATSLSDGYEAACVTAALAASGTKHGESEPAAAPSPAIATAFKPYVGHMLAASGIVETLCAVLAMKRGSVPATLHTREGKTRFPVPVATRGVARSVRTLLKLFTGFTGHDAALVLRRT